VPSFAKLVVLLSPRPSDTPVGNPQASPSIWCVGVIILPRLFSSSLPSHLSVSHCSSDSFPSRWIGVCCPCKQQSVLINCCCSVRLQNNCSLLSSPQRLPKFIPEPHRPQQRPSTTPGCCWLSLWLAEWWFRFIKQVVLIAPGPSQTPSENPQVLPRLWWS
jgi:hypothetical protein